MIKEGKISFALINFLTDIFTHFDAGSCKLIGGPEFGGRAENGKLFR